MRISDWSSDVCSSDLFVDDLHHLADTFPGNDDAIDLDTFRLVRGDAGKAVSVGRDGEKLVFEDVEEDAGQIIAGFFGGTGVAGAAEHLAAIFSRNFARDRNLACFVAGKIVGRKDRTTSEDTSE